MTVTTPKKYLDSDTLIRLNSVAVKRRYNRALSGGMLDRLDPEGLHLEVLAIPHENRRHMRDDDHVRVLLMMKVKDTMAPVEGFLDVGLADYQALPEVTPELLTAARHKTMLCPRCQKRQYTPYASGEVLEGIDRSQLDEFPFPALSRTDNKSYICSPCGEDEALLDFNGAELPGPDHWPLP